MHVNEERVKKWFMREEREWRLFLEEGRWRGGWGGVREKDSGSSSSSR